MENPSSPRLGKLSSSGLPRVRTAKHGHLQDPGSLPCPENNRNSPESDNLAEGKRKGRPKTDVQELRSIPAIMIEQWKEEFKRRSRVKCPCSGCWLEFPSIYGVKYHYQRCQGATVGEKLSHGCPYCDATFATKIRLEKHKLWNHPERVSLEARDDQHKVQKKAIKTNSKKRPLEHSPPSPVFFKVKKIHETFTPFHNGELTHHKSERKPPSVNQPSPHIHQSVQSQSQQSHSASSDAGGSESEGGSLPPLYSDEDPERMRHRRKQKTPKKFTGEQPSISGTFGLKGMTKVEEKLKAGRLKKAEGNFNEASQKRPAPNQSSKKDQATTSSSGSVTDTLWQKAISERGEVVCPTCSIVTRKTIQGLKNHMEICQKLQDALKCLQCHKQFRSKAGLNYHIMAEHSTKASGSESQVADERDERERLRRTLKQMGRIKCPSEHSGKNHRSKAGRDYHAHTEHSAAFSSAVTVNSKDHVTDTNNNTGKDKISEVAPPAGKKEQHERREWHDQPRQHKNRESRADEQKGSNDSVKAVQNAGLQEDFERTPSGRVRRRSAQVAVFHLQEIAEDELAKDWGGTKRRNKDDLVPDSKRLNYTRPGLPNFSPELIETWKNQVKERGFICCTNENCEAVYSSVSGLKAHLANCSQRGGELGKYTCLICQKAFNSESGVKYHISKTHSQNWFRAAASEVVSSSKPKSLEDNGIEPEVRNGATTGKKRGRKPKERRPVAEPLHTLTEESVSSQNSSPAMSRSSSPTQMLTDEENSGLNHSLLDRRNKPKKLLLSE